MCDEILHLVDAVGVIPPKPFGADGSVVSLHTRILLRLSGLDVDRPDPRGLIPALRPGAGIFRAVSTRMVKSLAPTEPQVRPRSAIHALVRPIEAVQHGSPTNRGPCQTVAQVHKVQAEAPLTVPRYPHHETGIHAAILGAQ